MTSFPITLLTNTTFIFQEKYHPPQDDHGASRPYARVSRFSNRYKRGYVEQTSYSTTTLIREKDLIQNARQFDGSIHGYGDNHYGSYHYDTQAHYSEFHDTSRNNEQKSQEKDPKNDPLFKSAVDGCITTMKTKGDYDQVRRECLSDIDTKVITSFLQCSVVENSHFLC